VGIRLDLSFAQAGFLAVKSNYNTTFTENANGSFIYNHKQQQLYTSNRASIGKGGLIISPFLDLNDNGKRDAGEPKADGLKLIINGGRLENNIPDTLTQIFDLEPFTTYYIKIQPQSFDNISWSVKNKTMNVVVDPNNLKLVEIPVIVAAEISGMVYLEKNGVRKGQNKIVVLIYSSDSTLVAKTMTEQDGFFSVLSLRPGQYHAVIDPGQLNKLKMTAAPSKQNFIVRQSVEGDVIDDLEFTIYQQEPDLIPE
jgi:hypothetical protein